MLVPTALRPEAPMLDRREVRGLSEEVREEDCSENRGTECRGFVEFRMTGGWLRGVVGIGWSAGWAYALLRDDSGLVSVAGATTGLETRRAKTGKVREEGEGGGGGEKG
jgi:hypothetical protein